MPRIAALSTERTSPLDTDRIPIEPAAGGGAQYIQKGNLAGGSSDPLDGSAIIAQRIFVGRG